MYVYELDSWIAALKRRRQERGITLRTMADLLTCHVSTVWKIENRQRDMHMTTFLRYCHILGYDLYLTPRKEVYTA